MIRNIAKVALVFLATSALTLMLVEGLSGLILAAKNTAEILSGDSYTQYDSKLGWVSIPGTHLRNAYGKGKSITIDQRGFRSDSTALVKQNKDAATVVCSGNSFTFGEGVADNQTWCHQMTNEMSNIQTINLGYPGYGVDQSYLRYLREKPSIQHQYHIFAFIAADLVRASRAMFYGHGKPVFAVKDGALRLQNVPVPKLLPRLLWISQTFVSELRITELSRRLLARMLDSQNPTRSADSTINLDAQKQIFRNLHDLSVQEGVRLIFVYIPIQSELHTPLAIYPEILQMMEEENLPFVDLAAALRERNSRSAVDFYLDDDELGEGHLNENGHRWVAHSIATEMEQFAGPE
jgi:hypothetical protein